MERNNYGSEYNIRAISKLTKQYKHKKNKLIETEKKMKERTENIDQEISKLKEKKRDLEKPYLSRIEKFKKSLEELDDKILEYHNGINEKVSTRYADVYFKTSKSVKIKDKNKALRILKRQGILMDSIKIYKNQIRKLIDNGIIDKNIADYEVNKSISIKGYESLNRIENDIYSRLHKLRNKIADDQGIKKYFVFNNETLRKMAIEKPETKEEMLEIKGVGDITYDKYGEQFLKAIKA